MAGAPRMRSFESCFCVASSTSSGGILPVGCSRDWPSSSIGLDSECGERPGSRGRARFGPGDAEHSPPFVRATCPVGAASGRCPSWRCVAARGSRDGGAAADARNPPDPGGGSDAGLFPLGSGLGAHRALARPRARRRSRGSARFCGRPWFRQASRPRGSLKRSAMSRATRPTASCSPGCCASSGRSVRSTTLASSRWPSRSFPVGLYFFGTISDGRAGTLAYATTSGGYFVLVAAILRGAVTDRGLIARGGDPAREASPRRARRDSAPLDLPERADGAGDGAGHACKAGPARPRPDPTRRASARSEARSRSRAGRRRGRPVQRHDRSDPINSATSSGAGRWARSTRPSIRRIARRPP